MFNLGIVDEEEEIMKFQEGLIMKNPQYEEYLLEKNESGLPDFPSFKDWLDPDAPRRRAQKRYAAMCDRDEQDLY